jgi:KDO2-lipid IV(A) lauroyltransferase
VLYGAVLAISLIGRRIPLRTGQAIGRLIGGLAYHVTRRQRRKALHNIAIAFPDWPSHRHRAVIKAMFRHLGASLFEMVWLPNLDPKKLEQTTIFEGVEPIDEAIRSGRAVVAFGAHCGNWEWMANALHVHGVPVTAMQRERDEGGFNDFILWIRSHSGMKTIDRGSDASPRALIQAIRRPNLVGFLIDQSMRAESVKIPFFGLPALTPIGPARLAVRTDALVVSLLARRNANGQHHVIFGPMTPAGDDPHALTARMTRAIEEQIRAAPEQWVWMHDRWRDRPQWNVGGDDETEPA